MGNLFGGLARPGNNRGATAEAIPVVRDKATESEKEAERYISLIFTGLPSSDSPLSSSSFSFHYNILLLLKKSF